MTLTLLDVVRVPVQDPAAIFTFRRLQDNRQFSDQITRVLSGAPAVFSIPARASDVVLCELDLQRYRFARSDVFFRTPGVPVQRESLVFREPLEWTPDFTSWNALTAEFDDLKTVLTNSADVLLLATGDSLGQIVDHAYDAIAQPIAVLAKTALLNIYYRLRSAMEPVSGNRSWFSYVRDIIAIDQERFLAFIDADMESIVRHIHDNIDEFRGGYEQSFAELHRGKVPPDLRVRIDRMVSIKSSHDQGNFQLTLSILKNPREVLLDADIDESGQLLGHLFDTFKHKVTGGTHPHDIHEILWFQHGRPDGLDLGYRLVEA